MLQNSEDEYFDALLCQNLHVTCCLSQSHEKNEKKTLIKAKKNETKKQQERRNQ
jgi:hypothetical protein